jgi:hypothetical protein
MQGIGNLVSKKIVEVGAVGNSSSLDVLSSSGSGLRRGNIVGVDEVVEVGLDIGLAGAAEGFGRYIAGPVAGVGVLGIDTYLIWGRTYTVVG